MSSPPTGPGPGRSRALVLAAAVCFGTTGTAQALARTPPALAPDAAAPLGLVVLNEPA